MMYYRHSEGGDDITKSKNEIQREYEKRTRYAAQRKFDRENTKSFTFRFMKKTESDLIEKLESVENKAGYIKKLIRDDISKNG